VCFSQAGRPAGTAQFRRQAPSPSSNIWLGEAVAFPGCAKRRQSRAAPGLALPSNGAQAPSRGLYLGGRSEFAGFAPACRNATGCKTLVLVPPRRPRHGRPVGFACSGAALASAQLLAKNGAAIAQGRMMSPCPALGLMTALAPRMLAVIARGVFHWSPLMRLHCVLRPPGRSQRAPVSRIRAR